MPPHRTVGFATFLLAALLSSAAQAQQEATSVTLSSLPPIEPVNEGAEVSDELTATVLDDLEFYSEADPPWWTVEVGTILLWRSRPSSQELLLDSGSSQSLNANQLIFDMLAGPEVSARWRGDRFGFDLRYFGVDDMGAEADVPALNLGSFGQGPPVGSLRGLPSYTPVYDFDFDYRTSLQSIEVNIRSSPVDNIDLLAGFRYLLLRDDLGMTVERVDGPILIAPFAIHSIGINRLAGAQVGLETRSWLTTRWRLNTVAKAGIFGNAATSTGRLDLDYGSQFYTFGRSLFSFAGEIGMNSELALSKRWSMLIGYQTLWLVGVTLASEQSASYRKTDDARVGDGDVIFLGVQAGLQAAW